MKKLRVREDYIRELFLILGFTMLGWGLWQLFQPLMWLVCGTILMWLGWPPKGGSS